MSHKLVRYFLSIDIFVFVGTRLRLTIVEARPFIILKNPATAYTGMTGNYKQIEMAEFDGLYKDILVYLQEKMQFIPVVMLAKSGTQYDQLVEGVANDLFDTVMSTITVTSERAKLVDMSLALIPSSIRVIVRKPKPNGFDFFFFLKPFENSLWVLVLVTIPYTILLLYPRKVDNNGILGRISCVFYAMLGRDSDKFDLSWSEHVLVYCLHILQIVLFALYTARLLPLLTEKYADTLISGIDDIKNGEVLPSRIGLVSGSSIELF